MCGHVYSVEHNSVTPTLPQGAAAERQHHLSKKDVNIDIDMWFLYDRIGYSFLLFVTLGEEASGHGHNTPTIFIFYLIKFNLQWRVQNS